MANIVRTVIQFRRDTSANWAAHSDVVPAPGEPCFEIDTGIFKIGDGETQYGNLKPIGGVKLTADGESIVLEDGIFKLAGFDAAEIGAQPKKVAEGKIEWVVPSTVDVDALKKVVDTLSETVATIKETVDDLVDGVEILQDDVTDLKAIVGASDEGSGTLLSRVEGLEFKMDGTGEGTVDAKIDAKIDELFELTNDNGSVDTIKELFKYVADHGSQVTAIIDDISGLKDLVGSESVHDQIVTAIEGSGHISKTEAMDTLLSKVEAENIYKRVKYEITDKPIGTLVDYREKEIRVMCPVGTKFTKQNVGANGNPNMYYMTFKAYAPDGAVSFKEGDKGVIVDKMITFDDSSAGVDEYGRKYSICWLALASYDAGTDTWTYFGSNSTANKYIGWTYCVEWYDADGIMVESDSIRINLSNEKCHNIIEPYYMANVVKGVSVNGTLLDMIDGNVDITIPEIKESDEIAVNEDGSLSIKAISFNKITQGEDDILIMDGGSAV